MTNGRRATEEPRAGVVVLVIRPGEPVVVEGAERYRRDSLPVAVVWDQDPATFHARVCAALRSVRTSDDSAPESAPASV
jgi:hypothetical protein